MKQRLRSLTRIVEIKEHQRRAAEWQLARLQSEEASAIEEQQSVIAALNAAQPLHGLFIDTMARHLRKISERLDGVRNAKDAQAAQLQVETGQLRRAERMLKDGRRRHERALDRKELAELIEASLSRGDASFP